MKIIRYVLGLLLLLFLLFMIIPIPMGTGSESFANKWSENFLQIENIHEAIELSSDINHKEFENGEWIFGISSDSHNNPWGGTIVTKDSNGNIKSFFGHVCGPSFIMMPLYRSESLDDFYANLQGFTEYKTHTCKTKN